MGRCIFCKLPKVPNQRILHVFPACEKTRKKWIEFMKQDPATWTQSKHARLCSDHFDVDCYQLSGLRTALLPGSIPTLACQVKDFVIIRQNIMKRYKEFSSEGISDSELPNTAESGEPILTQRDYSETPNFSPESLLPPTITIDHDHSYLPPPSDLMQELKRKREELTVLKREHKNLKAVLARRDAKIKSFHKKIIDALEQNEKLGIPSLVIYKNTNSIRQV